MGDEGDTEPISLSVCGTSGILAAQKRPLSWAQSLTVEATRGLAPNLAPRDQGLQKTLPFVVQI